MIWFSSDHHLGHHNIIKYCGRPFPDVYQMDSTLIKNINHKIKKDDTLYILGDFAFLNPQKYRYSINCKNVILITGNHDAIKKNAKPRDILYDIFTEVHQFLIININKIKLALFHYPLESWPGDIHLHGHSHGKAFMRQNRIDVGVDCHNFHPISIREVLNYVD